MVNVIADDAEALAVAARLGERFAEGASQRDAQRILPEDELDELSRSGLLGITVPRRHGGAEVSYRTLGGVFRLLAAGDSSIGQIPQNHFFFLDVLRHNATERQLTFFHAEVLAGKRLGNALAEAGAKNAHAFETKLVEQPGGDFRISGTKNYTTGALFAHWIPVFAIDGEDRVNAAFVPSGADGLAVLDDWDGIGQRTTASGTVLLDDVHVPAERVVPHYRTFDGPEIFGAFGQYLHAAIDVGIADAALSDGGEAVRELSRPWWEAGVERTADEPLVVQRFGELALRVRAAGALLAEAGDALDDARRALDSEADDAEAKAAEASIAVAAVRAQADEAAVSVSSEIFALIGARAARTGRNLDRHWRNARTHTLHDPRRWKVQHLGNYALNGIRPPRNGIV
ncbi:SfnB family sulfur acquisition oxidoreductase [Saccharopolyspora sp. NPDC002686]|uniref:SfnB family sulfur acquisition oxidoreductase n=1 Tax=Saccharopolyspora sp. NPDC002686 TaxID=3154541 RepID=UPI003327A8AB